MHFTKVKGILSSKNGMNLFKISNGSAATKRIREKEKVSIETRKTKTKT